jgi:hypothetical protein
MDAHTLKILGFAFLGLAIVLGLLWGSISNHQDALAKISAIAAVLGLFVGLGAIIVAHGDSSRGSGVNGPASVPTVAAGSPQAGSASPAATDGVYPGATTLPSDSPLKESGIPHMETVCSDLGRPADAWVPGQTAPHSIVGRVLRGPGQAYRWTCGGPDGPTITRDDITNSCQKNGWGEAAYTWDPSYAYSWFCK